MASNAPDGPSASNFTTNVPHNWCHNPLQQSHSSRWNSNIPLPQLSPQDFADANFLVRFWLHYMQAFTYFPHAWWLQVRNQSTTSEKLSFIYALSENDLRVGRNSSYLNLEKENVALRTCIDNLQWVPEFLPHFFHAYMMLGTQNSTHHCTKLGPVDHFWRSTMHDSCSIYSTEAQHSP